MPTKKPRKKLPPLLKDEKFLSMMDPTLRAMVCVNERNPNMTLGELFPRFDAAERKAENLLAAMQEIREMWTDNSRSATESGGAMYARALRAIKENT